MAFKDTDPNRYRKEHSEFFYANFNDLSQRDVSTKLAQLNKEVADTGLKEMYKWIKAAEELRPKPKKPNPPNAKDYP